MKDIIKQFLSSRDSLQKEKAALENRLAQINRALSTQLNAAPTVTPKRKAVARVVNTLSLREAIVQATHARPLTKLEILAAVKKLGYRFATNDPMNSLGATLYNPKKFKNSGGKFTSVK